jgi:hypothetical protein
MPEEIPKEVPKSDLLAKNSSAPPSQGCETKISTVPDRSDPRRKLNADAMATRYPFTKGVSLRNEGVGYGEVMVERFVCVVGGDVHTKDGEKSVRTRTARTYPDIGDPVPATSGAARDRHSVTSASPPRAPK